MKVWFTYDESIDAWVLNHEGLDIADAATVEEWKTALFKAAEESFQGKRVFVVVDLANVHIAPGIAEVYGDVAKEFGARHCEAAFRYGPGEGMTKSVIHLQAVINHFPSNIYADRAAAVAALEAYRRQQAARAERDSKLTSPLV